MDPRPPKIELAPSSRVQEEVFRRNEWEVEPETPSSDLNHSTQYPLLRPPGLTDFLRGQTSDAISSNATASVSTVYSTNLLGQMADNDFWSPWKPYDNLTKIDNTYMGNYNGGDHRDANGAVGMDGEWHQFHPTQSLRLERTPPTARGLDSQEHIGILAAYTGPIYHSHPQTTAEGMPFENRQPTQFVPNNLQLQPFLHAPREHQPTKTTNEALASPQTSATPSAHQRMLRVSAEHDNEPWHLQISRLPKPASKPVP
jgi:hypothetical protein